LIRNGSGERVGTVGVGEPIKFHAVLVINSAHLLGQAASSDERLLPMLWALDNWVDVTDDRQGFEDLHVELRPNSADRGQVGTQFQPRQPEVDGRRTPAGGLPIEQ